MGERKYLAIGRVFEPTGEILVNGFDATDYDIDEYEINYLLKGDKSIIIESKNGNKVSGRLAKKTEGGECWIFKRAVPEEIASYKLSDKERSALEEGEELYIEKFWSPKKCKYYAATILWDGNNIIMKKI